MYTSNLLKRTCLVASAILLSVPQAAMAADEASVSISGWINEGLLYYDDGVGTGAAQISDNGTTLGSRITFSGDYKPENSALEAGFEVIIEPQSGNPNFAGGGSVTPLLFADQDNLETFNGGDIGLLGSSFHVYCNFNIWHLRDIFWQHRKLQLPCFFKFFSLSFYLGLNYFIVCFSIF